MMHLRVLLPDRILVDTQVDKVSVEGMEGELTLLPRHIDYATAIVPGLLVYLDATGTQHYMAVDRGVLVKQGDDVWISVWNAVRGENLDQLRDTVVEQFERLEDQEREARAVLAGLEADLVRRFIDLGRAA